jgi:hypothetical protein
MATLNVQDYGADPTSGGDDSGAINAALDDASSGDTVLIPAVPNPDTDYYSIDPGGEVGVSIGASESGVTLAGEGYDSVLRQAGGQSGNVFTVRVDAGSSAITDLTIENLRVDGNARNNGGANNGWGIIVMKSDASQPQDRNIQIRGCWVEDALTAGIQIARATTVSYCTVANGDKHGISTTYARNMASGEVNRIDHCHTYGNTYYGVDMHGKAEVSNHRGENDGYGFKSSNDFDVYGAGTGHVHTCRNSKFEGWDVFGFQLTHPVEELYLEDVEVADGGGWGFRLSEGGNYYIRGNGIKTVNTGLTRGSEGGIRIGGENGVNMVDESGTTAVMRVEETNGNTGVAINDSSSGSVDLVEYANVGTPVRENTSSGTNIESAQSASSVGAVSYPALSEVGAEAWGSDTTDSTEDTTTSDVEPASPMALTTTGGYAVTASGYTVTAGASATPGSGGSAGNLVTDFESIADLGATFDYGSRGFLSTAANYEDGGSQSLAVGGSDGGYEEMVATPNASDPLPQFFEKGEVANYYIRADTKVGYTGAIFGATDDQNFYAFNIVWDLDGVVVYNKSGGSFTNVQQESWLSGVGETNRWYQLRVVRDDGTLGGADDDIRLELRDPAADNTLWSYSFNDATHADGVGVGMHTNRFGSGATTFLDNVVKE